MWTSITIPLGVPLIDWISDTLSQGYTNLQSLVKCLDPRIIAVYAVKQRLCQAARCIDTHLGGHCYNRVELLTSKGAETSTVASAADCEVEVDSLRAG